MTHRPLKSLMSKPRMMWLGTLAALMLALQPARAQSWPTGGRYQIVSGQRISCCGFGGPLVERLPNAANAFIELTVDPQNQVAQLSILGQDGHTVLRIPPVASRSEFAYVLTNGTLLPDRIQFGASTLPPVPTQPVHSFLVVSNSIDTLSINGTVLLPCPGCADIPMEFQHTNVVAVRMPTATIRVREVEVCWNTASNRNYQVQYRSDWNPNVWEDLGAPIAGDGSVLCLTDKVPLGQPQRYYRVLLLP